MKKGLIIIAMLFLLVNLVSALDIPLSKTTYYPGETLQAEIPDVFTSNLQQANIGIYAKDAVHKTPAEIGLVKSESKYYLYVILPQNAGDYAIKIENAVYMENNIQSSETIVKNFSIISTNESYLSFNPGVILTSNDFSINIKAYNREQEVTVNFPSPEFPQTFNLGLGQDKIVYFSIANITSFSVLNIKLNNYNIPAIISPKISNNITNQTVDTQQPLNEIIDIFPKEINATLIEKLDYYFNILIVNKLQQAIGDVNISVSDKEIVINQTKIFISGEDKNLNITINSERDFSGNINFSYKNSSISIPLNIIITQNKSNVTSNVPIINQQKTCQSLGGVVCDVATKEKCTGVEADSLDGACCLAECKVQSASKTWIWGLVLLVFLAIGGWLLYKKSKKAPGQEKVNEIFKKRTEDYEKKVSPDITEVKKSLTKD